jgi:antitoxin component YwqK of YwqJK toxin-antitoxin module
VKLKGAHLDGEMHGDWEFFRTDGSMMRSGRFHRGKQIGIWRTYNRAGRVVKATEFK